MKFEQCINVEMIGEQIRFCRFRPFELHHRIEVSSFRNRSHNETFFSLFRLIAVADISCDVNGSIEFLEKTTSIEHPFFQYEPVSGQVTDRIDNEGITVMGVDILPTELARESSEHFGDALLPLLRKVIQRENQNFILPIEFERACIAEAGELTSRYEYITAFMRKATKEVAEHPASYSILISLEVSE